MRTRSRQWKVCTLTLLAIGTAGTLFGKALIGARISQQEDANVQVSSVTVEPSAIHTAGEPNSAVVTVQMMVRGHVPDNTMANVEVATFATHPEGIKVKYGPIQAISLKKSPAVAQFRVEIDSQTSPGRVIAAASIIRTTNDVKIKSPERAEDWRAEFQIANP